MKYITIALLTLSIVLASPVSAQVRTTFDPPGGGAPDETVGGASR